MEPHRATTSVGAGAVKRCGSDSSNFEIMFNKKNMFQNCTKSSAAALCYAAPGSDFGLKL
jgi:hypothetical protein